jgi:hypothetical protein
MVLSNNLYLIKTAFCAKTMSIVLKAILEWADTPGIEILEITDSSVRISSPIGSPIGTAIATLKEETYEVEYSSLQLKVKIEEIIERALAEERAVWQRGHEWYTISNYES